MRQFILALMSVGTLLQGAYIYLYTRLPISELIMLITITLALVAIAIALSKDGKRVLWRFEIPLLVLFILFIYSFINAQFYRGSDLFGFLEPFFSFSAMTIILISLARCGRDLPYISRGLLLICAAVSCVHFFNVNFGAFQVAAGNAAERYGYVEGRNMINLTGQNLSLMLLSAYFIFRYFDIGITLRTISAMTVLLLVPPVLASGSRAALATIAFAIGVSEFALLSISGGIRLVVSLVGLGIIGVGAVYFLSDYEHLVSYAWDRMALLGTENDAAASVRLDNMLAAISLDWGLIFGTGLTGAEFLGWSPDNWIASTVISCGVFGIFFIAIGLARLMLDYVKIAKIGICGLAVLSFPLAIRALAESTYLHKSAAFPLITYFIVVSVVYSKSFGLGGKARLWLATDKAPLVFRREN